MVDMRSLLAAQKSLMTLAGSLWFAGLVASDYHHRNYLHRMIDGLIASHQNLVDQGNYYPLSIKLERLSLIDRGFQGLAMYVTGERKLGPSSFPNQIDLNLIPAPQKGSIGYEGLFHYRILYAFANQDYALMMDWRPPMAWPLAGVWSLVVLLALIVSIILRQRRDIDGLGRIRNEYAVLTASRVIHFIKTYSHFAGEVYKWLQEVGTEQPLPDGAQASMAGFALSQIEMEGVRSILRLGNYKGALGSTDITATVNLLVECYRKDELEVRYSFGHHSSLAIDRDVFIATVGNLIKNACDYSDGLMWVKTTEDNSTICVIVSNTGKRLTGLERKNILSDGYSIEGQSGLGLGICQVWLARVGGSLELESTHGATTFIAKFPMATQAKKPRVRKPGRVPKTGLSHIALVEDLPSFRKVLEQEWQLNGWTVKSFSDPHRFLDELDQDIESFKVIVIDRHLKGFDAVRERFCDACRHSGFKGGIVLYTGDLSPAENRHATHLFNKVVHKGDEVDWQKVLDPWLGPVPEATSKQRKT